MNYVYAATSLDGYIATRDGGVAWLHELPNPNNDDYGYSEFMENIDELIVTRIPILLGDGIPLFGALSNPLRFVHKNTEVYAN